MLARTVLALSALVLTCGGFSCAKSSAEEGESGLAFHGEGSLLNGFSFNTGPQPPTGPANVSLRLSGSGVVKVDARARVESSALVGNAASGKLAIDAHVKLDGTLKIDSPIKKSTGDIPGLKDIDIAIAGASTFDPFLLDATSAEVTANIPETKLPDVPLGSVPGKLQLTVVAGSKLTTTYRGSCMTIESGLAHYRGSAVTSGTLVIRGTIVLELPSPLNKSIDLPEITVPVPSATSDVKFAVVATAGATDGTTGSCATDADAGADGDPGSDGANEDSGTVDSTVTDSGGFDTSTTDSVSPDVSTDTAPTRCTGEEPEPNDTPSMARTLGAIDDCDGSGKSTSGVLSSASDVDVYKFDGKDTFGCSVNAYVKITGPVKACIKAVCKSGTTEFKGCTKGIKSVESECCSSTEAEIDFNCTGTTSEDTTVTMIVTSTASTLTCGGYTLAYHY